MNPTTDIIYNYEYAKRLYRGEDNFEDVWQRIIAQGAAFQTLYDELIDYILTAIEKYSGFSWGEHAEDHFPIYLAEPGRSFFTPLTLAVNISPVEMMLDLTYQLAHRNMNFGFLSLDLRDQCLGAVTSQVANDLKIKLPSPLPEWHLDKKTIKQYLNKK